MRFRQPLLLVIALALVAAVSVAATTTRPAPSAASAPGEAAAGRAQVWLEVRSGVDEVPEVVPAGSATSLAVHLQDELAWDLRDLRGGEEGEEVGVRLLQVEGPGRFVAFTRSIEGQRALLDSEDDGLVASLPVGEQGAMWWWFEEPGLHRLHLEVRVPDAAGAVTLPVVRDVLVLGPTAVDPQGQPSATTPTSTSSTSTPAGPTASPSSVPVDRAAVGAAEVGAAASERVVIDDGHVDMGPRFVDGTWVVQLKDDTVSPHVWRNLRDVVLHARESSRIEVPAGGGYAFLGEPGSDVYLLPQAQQPGLVWPGWNSQDPSVTSQVPGSITWRLHAVDGPGRFVLFSSGSFGQTQVLFDDEDPLPQELAIARNTHVHANWAFTEPGIYRLTVEMAAQRSGGGQVSDTRILTVVVGDDVDPATAFTDDPPGSDPPPDGEGAGGSGSGSGGSGSGSGGSGGSGGGTDRLASTGVHDLDVQLLLAVALLSAGALALAAASPRVRGRVSFATPRPTEPEHNEEGSP